MNKAAEACSSESAVHKQNKTCKTAVLVSGGGTNLQALIDYEKTHADCPFRIEAVFSDTKKAYAIERASKAGIRTQIVSPYAILGTQGAAQASKDEKRKAVSKRILALCKERGIEFIVLAGFLTVLSGELIGEYDGRMINLHPALLPDFGGEGMWGHHVHEAVLASGKKESGCTVHFVNSGCDTGKIILQKKVPVLPGDTPDSLAARLAPEEHKAIVEAACTVACMIVNGT